VRCLFVRAVVFTVLIPGTVAFVVPSGIVREFPIELSLGVGRYIGFLPILFGIALYALSVFSLVVEGRGTPLIWFARPFRFFLGEEPGKLVIGGLYKMTRNPMYLGVISAVLGQAVLFQSGALIVYACCLFFIFHTVVVFIEEPHLRRKFGEEYERYLKSTHRWVGIH